MYRSRVRGYRDGCMPPTMLPPQRSSGRWGHVPALDGIRGLAVLGVVAHHLGHLRGGYLGVDAFFVLSGFLITNILLEEYATRGGIDLSRFWTRRARRLMPALVAVLAAVLTVERWLVDGVSDPALRREGLATLGYLYNWFAIADDVDYWSAFTAPSPLRHMWSLAIEEQFYVVWPLAVVAVGVMCRRRGRSIEPSVGLIALVGIAVSVAIAQAVWSPADTLRVYYGTDTRIAAILMGVAAAVLVRRLGLDRSVMPRRSWVGASGAILLVPIGWAWAVLDGTDELLYRGGLVATGVATTAVIVLVHQSPGTALDRALSWPLLRWLGRVSYGLYLWHWPIIVWMTPERTGLDGVALSVARVAVSLAVTVASFHLVEQPLRHRSTSPRRTLGVAVPTVLAMVLATVVVTSGPADARPGAGTRSTVPVPPTVEPRSAESSTLTSPPGPDGTPDGGAGDTPAVETSPEPMRLMIVGDSGAYFLGEALGAAASGDVVVLPRGEIGCGIVNLGGGASTDLGFLPDPPECERWPDRWSADAAAFAPTDVLVVLSWPGIGDRELDGRSVHPCDPLFDAHHRERFLLAVERAGSTGADVWLANSPDLAGEMSDDLSRQRIACINTSIESAVEAANSIELLAGRVHVLDIRSWVCPAEQCRVDIDGDVLRPDGLHFEGPGGLRAASWILGRLS
ncbi:MAG: hypothetical protein RLZZ01_2483 [Actinomycetota bacterium]